MSGELGGHAGWPASRAFVRGPVLDDRRAHGVSEPFGELVVKGNLSTLDRADGCRGDGGRPPKLGLGEAAEDAVVARESLVGCDVDELAHRNIEGLGDSGEEVHLRRRVTGFPVVQSAASDLREASKVGYGEVPRFANLREGAAREAAHHAPTHRHAPGATPPTMAIHCAAPVLRSSQAVSIDRGIVQTVRGG